MVFIVSSLASARLSTLVDNLVLGTYKLLVVSCLPLAGNLFAVLCWGFASQKMTEAEELKAIEGERARRRMSEAAKAQRQGKGISPDPEEGQARDKVAAYVGISDRCSIGEGRIAYALLRRECKGQMRKGIRRRRGPPLPLTPDRGGVLGASGCPTRRVKTPLWTLIGCSMDKRVSETSRRFYENPSLSLSNCLVFYPLCPSA